MASDPTTRTMKQHDLWPPLPCVLEDQNGPIDLTNAASVKFIAKNGSTLITGNCELDTDPETGLAMNRANGGTFYVWVSGDTDIAGSYKLEWEISWPTAKPETVPNSGTNTLVIEADQA